MIRSLFTAFLASAVFILGGCAMTEPLHSKPSTESTAVATARRVIDEGYALVISINNVIRDNAKAGVWTKSQADAYLSESEKVRADLDSAREMLAAGDVFAAQNKAELMKAALLSLQRRVAAEARGG